VFRKHGSIIIIITYIAIDLDLCIQLRPPTLQILQIDPKKQNKKNKKKNQKKKKKKKKKSAAAAAKQQVE